MVFELVTLCVFVTHKLYYRFERIADGWKISFSNRLNTKYTLKAGI